MELTKTDIKQLNDFERFFSFIPTWAFGKLINLANKRISLFTGNQCLGGESLIYDPILDKEMRVDTIESDFHVLAWDGNKLVTTKAQVPYKKDVDNLYEFTLSNGQSFVASMSQSDYQ